MKDIGIVYGSKEQAVPLVIGTDTVYEHTDIEAITETDERTGRTREVYKYHEIQYTKDEFIMKQTVQNEQLQNQITDTQLALCEVYELMG